MAKKKSTPVSPPAPSPPQIYEASFGANGAVMRGPPITQAEAEARRRQGQDVVVCGADLAANRRLAGEIERNANGNVKRDPPHSSTAGPLALPHYQPDPRPPAGHTFYETDKRKAI